MKLSNRFEIYSKRFTDASCSQNFLTFCFAMAAVSAPFSTEVAVGAAISPTLLHGSALLARGAAKILVEVDQLRGGG